MAKIRSKHPIVGTIVNKATMIIVCISFQSENRISELLLNSHSLDAIINYNPWKNNGDLIRHNEWKNTKNPGE